jgi:hypothetical protein
LGSKADIAEYETNVRFTPESGHQSVLEIEGASTLYAVIGRRMPLSANSPTGSTATALLPAERVG